MQSQEKPPTEPTEMQPQNSRILPLSGKPYHGVILSKSHVAPICNMVSSRSHGNHSEILVTVIVINGIGLCVLALSKPLDFTANPGSMWLV